MKKLLLLCLVLANCSVTPETENSEIQDNSTYSAETSSYNSRMSRKPGSSDRLTSRFEDNISGTDWRTNPEVIRDELMFGWVVGGKRFFEYRTSNGKLYTFNFTFFHHRKDVWYSVVDDRGIVMQEGWSTVKLHDIFVYVADIEFDVEFGENTMIPANAKMVISRNRQHPAEHRANWSRDTEHSDRMHLQEGHRRGNANVERNYTLGEDWRRMINADSKYLFHWFFRNGEKRSFQFVTEDGEFYWFNFTFFNHRKDVWYSVVSDEGIYMQKGWTTAWFDNGWTQKGQMYIEVEFDPQTKMPAKTVLHTSRGVSSQPGEHRVSFKDGVSYMHAWHVRAGHQPGR